MISSVCPTDGGRVLPRLTLHLQGVRAGTCRRGRTKPGERVVVQPQLADIGGHFVDGEGAGPGGCWSVGARISQISGFTNYLQSISVSPPWVFKIGNVGGDYGATRRSRNYTADSEASSAVPISIATIAGALTGGEAGPVNAGIERELVERILNAGTCCHLASEKAVQALLPN